MQQKSRHGRIMLVLLLLLVLMGTPACSTMGLGVTSPPMSATLTAAIFCENAKPIRWSRNDTIETVEQAKAHNRVYRELCLNK